MSDSDAKRNHDDEQAAAADPENPDSEAAENSEEAVAVKKDDAVASNEAADSAEPDDSVGAKETRDAATESASDTTASSEDVGGAQAPNKDNEKRDKWFWHWVVGIVAVLCIELYIYGHNGKIEVCVGVEGVTDWSLIGKPKTPENFARSPKCAQRMNLGMYGDSEEAARAALDEACARATTTNHVARTDCVRRDKKWSRKVFKEQIAPWDERLYKRLLWLE